MDKSHDLARLLVEKASEDQFALDALIGAAAPEAIIGFHAQQAVEKLVKAVLTAMGVYYARTHDLEHLLGLLKEAGVGLPPDAGEFYVLTPYAAEFRYDRVPPEPQTGGPFDQTWAAECVRRTRQWAESTLRQMLQ